MRAMYAQVGSGRHTMTSFVCCVASADGLCRCSTAGLAPAGRDVSAAMTAIPRRSGPVGLKRRAYYRHYMLLSGMSIGIPVGNESRKRRQPWDPLPAWPTF